MNEKGRGGFKRKEGADKRKDRKLIKIRDFLIFIFIWLNKLKKEGKESEHERTSERVRSRQRI